MGGGEHCVHAQFAPKTTRWYPGSASPGGAVDRGVTGALEADEDMLGACLEDRQLQILTYAKKHSSVDCRVPPAIGTVPERRDQCNPPFAAHSQKRTPRTGALHSAQPQATHSRKRTARTMSRAFVLAATYMWLMHRFPLRRAPCPARRERPTTRYWSKPCRARVAGIDVSLLLAIRRYERKRAPGGSAKSCKLGTASYRCRTHVLNARTAAARETKSDVGCETSMRMVRRNRTDAGASLYEDGTLKVQCVKSASRGMEGTCLESRTGRVQAGVEITRGGANAA